MIQNSNPANNQGAPNPMLRRNQGDDFLRLQDLFYLCLAVSIQPLFWRFGQ